MLARQIQAIVAATRQGVPSLSVKAIMYLAPLPGIWETIPGLIE